MGLFNLFNKKSKEPEKSSDHPLVLQGPRYLRQYLTAPKLDAGKISDPKIEWAGQLISSAGNTLFQIKYFGTLIDKEIIANNDELVNKVIAIDVETKEEILLFDKALHGYDGFIAEAYAEQINSHRPTETIYTSKNGSDRFQIIFKAYYNYGTRKALMEFTNERGQIEFDNGQHLDLQDAFDDAFDGLSVYAIDESGKKFQIIDEELA